MTSSLLDDENPTAPRTFADVEAILASVLPGYEQRPGQQKLAATIEGVIDTEVATRKAAYDLATGTLNDDYKPMHLMAQAPCGSGKSFAALIPAILSGHKILFSVTTKALQDQVAYKDLPFLETYLPPFTWTMLKGRSNYLCLRRAASDRDPMSMPHLTEITAYAEQHPEFSGLREDLPMLVSDGEWAHLHSDADDCKALRCSKSLQGSDGGTCYSALARQRAAHCQIVVVNHSLLCADLSVGGAILGSRDLVIADEAHTLEESAADCLGYRLTEGSYTSTRDDLRSFTKEWAANPEDALAEIDPSLGRLTAAANDLFAELPRICGQEKTLRMKQPQIDRLEEPFGELLRALAAVRQAWRAIRFELDGTEKTADRKNLIGSTLTNLITRTTDVVEADQIDIVRWIEKEQRPRYTRWIIQAAPVSVAEFLANRLWSQTPVILMSATMKVKGNFRFLAGRLGITNAVTLTVDSPFDFRTQSALYVPRGLGTPKGSAIATFEERATEEIVRLITASQGRAMVLFTSLRHLKATAEAVRGRIPYNLLVQGEASNKVIKEQFERETDSVLFGSRSFFLGVDFIGPTLSLLVITKLPFAVPTDPMTEARSERLEAQGKSSFGDYSLPMMSLLIQQAQGRLIRHTTDSGVTVIMDPRIVDSGYGKTIISDMPPLPLTRDLVDVERFFADH